MWLEGAAVGVAEGGCEFFGRLGEVLGEGDGREVECSADGKNVVSECCRLGKTGWR